MTELKCKVPSACLTINPDASIAPCCQSSVPYQRKVGQYYFNYDLDNINFRLEKNGKIVQQSNSKNMIWKIDELIAYASKYFTIKIGDIMFTGTPEGVGVVSEDDVLEGFLGDEARRLENSTDGR